MTRTSRFLRPSQRWLAPVLASVLAPVRVMARVAACMILAWMFVSGQWGQFLQPASLLAQARGQDSARSTRGKEFRLTFLPNYHDNPLAARPNVNDSLFIFITCDKPTSGTIRFRNISGNTDSRTVRITDPTQFFILGLPFSPYELQGFNSGGTGTGANSQNERVAPQSFHITTDDDVTVYALNQARFTSDAALILPVNSLGKDYRVMSTESDASGGANSLVMPGTSTPSQFAVVASENNTIVRVTPRAPTPLNPTSATVTVRLNAGDSYLVQADPRTMGGFADLTGSRVLADKPVAVFGSHQRTTLPVRQRELLSSRDHLWEQLPGIETWGKEAFITPFVQPRAALLIGNDLYRVLAAYDNTRVSVNGQQVAVLNAGERYEGPLVEPLRITASDQILVAQFKKTANNSQGGIANTSLIGDPFMIVVPGTEQYDKTYRFINVRLPDMSVDGREVFLDHFITIITPTNFTQTVRLDENLVGAGRFQQIPNSSYSFANFQVSPGVHTARADTGIGLYVYGFGQANSYGYVGGGRLRFIAPDRDAPEVVSTTRCFETVGAVFDTLITDSRIARVEIVNTTLANVTASVQAFTPFADSVLFSGRLQNIYRDGSFIVRAQDSIGFITQRIIPIYGFTVGLEGQSTSLGAGTGMGTNPPVPQRRYTITTGRSRAYPLTLFNYGSTTQTITTLRFASASGLPGTPNASGSGNGFTILDPLPIVIQPSSRATVTVRFASAPTAPNGTIVTDTLIIGSSCATRSVAALSVESGQDTDPPRASRSLDSCSRQVTFNFRDDGPFDSGIAGIEALELRNLLLRSDTLGVFNAFNPEDSTGQRIATARLRVVLTVLDPRLDGIYSIRVRDSVGNTQTFRDTISGLTLRLVAQRAAATPALPNPPDTSGVFGAQPLAELVCRDLIYRNIGVRPFTLRQLAPRGNVYFSMPVPQFPITFQPGESKRVQLCFRALEARNYRDTLLLEQLCVADTLILTGAGIPVPHTENSRCDVVVRLVTTSAPREFFTEQTFPNPASSLVTIMLGIPSANTISSANVTSNADANTSLNVTVRLYNALGSYVATLANGVFPSGTVALEADVSRLESGQYFYEALLTTTTDDTGADPASQAASKPALQPVQRSVQRSVQRIVRQILVVH
jgi:hypothetical protein